MLRRSLVAVFLAAICWLGLSMLLLARNGHLGYSWDCFLMHLRDAVELDEELLIFVCILLASASLAVHLLAFGQRATYCAKFLLPQLGIVYAAVALEVGSRGRHLFPPPSDVWFHTFFSMAVVIGFIVLFWRPYLRILKREKGRHDESAGQSSP
jgi:hypothetical protein